jgi:hypothetical protein
MEKCKENRINIIKNIQNLSLFEATNILTCICLKQRLFRVTLEISRTAP